jgi:hypothetical protein
LEFWILIELCTENSVGVTIMRCVGLLKLDFFLALDLVIDSQNRLTASCQQLGAVVIKVQAVKLVVRVGVFLLHGAETLP